MFTVVEFGGVIRYEYHTTKLLLKHSSLHYHTAELHAQTVNYTIKFFNAMSTYRSLYYEYQLLNSHISKCYDYRAVEFNVNK